MYKFELMNIDCIYVVSESSTLGLYILIILINLCRLKTSLCDIYTLCDVYLLSIYQCLIFKFVTVSEIFIRMQTKWLLITSLYADLPTTDADIEIVPHGTPSLQLGQSLETGETGQTTGVITDATPLSEIVEAAEKVFQGSLTLPLRQTVEATETVPQGTSSLQLSQSVEAAKSVPQGKSTVPDGATH